jgi:hypothetical protein
MLKKGNMMRLRTRTYARTVKVALAQYGAFDTRINDVVRNMTQFYWNRGKFFEHLEPAYLQTIGQVYEAKEEYVLAESAYERAYDISKERFGPHHGRTKTFLQSYVCFLRQHGDKQKLLSLPLASNIRCAN